MADNNDTLRLSYTLELAEPPSSETRALLHNYLDHLLDANMTEYAATFVIDGGTGREFDHG